MLLQYRQVVRKLTGKTTESATMKEISDFIAQHTDLIRYREQIKDAIDAARADFLDRLAEGIIQGLRPAFSASLMPSRGSFGAGAESTLIVNAPESSPLHKAPLNICVQHWSEEKALLIGLEIKPQFQEDYRSLLKSMDLILERDSPTRHGHPKHSATQTWPTGWYDLISPFNDETLANLMKMPISDTVSKLCAEIRSDIELLERAYKDASAASPMPAAGAVS